MIKVFASPTLAIVRLAHAALEANGIASQVRNERLGGAVGEIPWTEVWPELWIVDGGDETRARAVLRDFEGEADHDALPAWTCPSCGELLEGQFGQCWSCGTERPHDAPTR